MNIDPVNSDASTGLGRRKFLNTAALAGLTTVVACTDKGAPPAGTGAAPAQPAAAAASVGEFGKYEVPPGQLDAS